MSLIETYALEENERISLTNICQEIEPLVHAKDEETLVIICKKNARLHKSTFEKLTSFIEYNFSYNQMCGAVKIIGLPPSKNHAVLTVLLGNLFGKIIKEYDDGVWIKQIRFDVSYDEKMDRPSAKDTKEFYFHTDLSYIETPPPYFLFNCISNPDKYAGSTILCGIEKIISKLPSNIIDHLLKKEFLFPAPLYYGHKTTVTNSILYKDKNDRYNIRFRRDGLHSLTKAGMNAISYLLDAIESEAITISLSENSALYVNNTKCLHGRLAFTASPEKIRHFMQVYISPIAN